MCVMFSFPQHPMIVCLRDSVTAEDIAEEIVLTAARPPDVNLAEVFVLLVNEVGPTLIYHRRSE